MLEANPDDAMDHRLPKPVGFATFHPEGGTVGTRVKVRDYLLYRLQQSTYRDTLAECETLIFVVNIDGTKHYRKEGMCWCVSPFH
jgi:hypothetical protein